MHSVLTLPRIVQLQFAAQQFRQRIIKAGPR
jgi:hypothetical protein